MKKIFITEAIIIIFTTLSFAINTGEQAPFFKVSDADGNVLSSESLKGKVVVGFYDSRNTGDKNIELQAKLNEFYKENKTYTTGAVVKLAIVDGSPANLASRFIWNKKLRLKSFEKKITIYGDWDGSMKQSFGFIEEESNFFIIDVNGKLRFSKTGKISLSDYVQVKDLLINLTMEGIKKNRKPGNKK